MDRTIGSQSLMRKWNAKMSVLLTD